VIRATVIVPARDAAATLPRTLAALADQEGAPSFEVVVADLGSGDGTAAIAERAGARLVGGSANTAVSAGSGALLAFCGADCFPAPGWLAAGTRALGHADLVQGAVLPDPRTEPGPFDDTRAVTAETGLCDMSSLFTTRELFERIGGFEAADGPPRAAVGPPGAAPAPPGAVPGSPRAAVGPPAAAPAPPRHPPDPFARADVRFGWRARRAGARTAFCAEALCHRSPAPREPLEYLEEHTLLRHLPAAVAQFPELRETLLHRRVFRSSRSLKLDLALAAIPTAAVRRSALPLLAAAPYALELRRHARERGGEDWKAVAAVDAAADLLGAAALLHGSVEARTPVL
jgi:Glycosyl transferase family 2